MGGETQMNLVFKLDGVICTDENDRMLWKHARPLMNVAGFMEWLKKEGHSITIWCILPNDMETKLMTESWLETENIPYDRLLFDRPREPIFVDDTPPNAKYMSSWGDNEIVAAMFEEWKIWITKRDQKKQAE